MWKGKALHQARPLQLFKLAKRLILKNFRLFSASRNLDFILDRNNE